MKIDQKELIKQRFWIAFGVAVLMTLVALIVIPFGVAKTVAQQREKVSANKKNLSDLTDLKNEQGINALKSEDEKISGTKDRFWERGWLEQNHQRVDRRFVPNPFMTWPEVMTRDESTRNEIARLYFGDNFHPQLRTMYSDGAYSHQLREIYELVQPVGRYRKIVKDKNKEVNEPEYPWVVEYLGGWQSVFRPMTKFATTPADHKEIWLAQEDLWVKRELLQIVRDTNDSVATFRDTADVVGPVMPYPSPEKPDPFYKRFRNPVWQLELTLDNTPDRKRVLKGKVTNITKVRQRLDQWFYVKLDQTTSYDRSFRIFVGGEPLAAGASKDIPATEIRGNVPQGIYGVQQVMSWFTAPVKRVDQLALAWHAHRFERYPLKPPMFLAPAPVDVAALGATDSAAGAVGPGSAAPVSDGRGAGGLGPMSNSVPDGGAGMYPGGMPGGPGGMGGMFGGGQQATTQSGLIKNRYVDVTKQVRRMPVGMTVLINQAHVPDFLSAFANSRMRIQTTQVHWKHQRGRIKPVQLERGLAGDFTGGEGFDTGAPTSAGDVDSPGGFGGMGRGGFGGAGLPGMAPGMTPGMTPGMAPGMAGMPGGPGGFGMLGGPGMGLGGQGYVETDESESNIIELSVYGIASLYERYPPKPEPATPATPAAPAVPAAP